MDKVLRFSPPFGSKILNPSIDLLRKIIFEYQSDYWSEDSTGDSVVDFYTKDESAYGEENNSILFFYDEPYVFFLYYDVQFVPIKKGIPLKDDMVVEHIVGCEPMRVPSICYRTREEAWEIIMNFINHQKMTEKYNWVPLGEIEYDDEPVRKSDLSQN